MELLGIAMEATKTNHEMQNFVRSPRTTKSAPFEKQSIACYGLQCLTDSVEARELVPALASKLSKCTEPRVWSDGGGPEVWTIAGGSVVPVPATDSRVPARDFPSNQASHSKVVSNGWPLERLLSDLRHSRPEPRVNPGHDP